MAYKRFKVTAPAFATASEVASLTTVIDARITDIGAELINNGLSDAQKAAAITQLTDSIALQGSELVARIDVAERKSSELEKAIDDTKTLIYTKADGLTDELNAAKDETARVANVTDVITAKVDVNTDDIALLAKDVRDGFQVMGGTVSDRV